MVGPVSRTSASATQIDDPIGWLAPMATSIYRQSKLRTMTYRQSIAARPIRSWEFNIESPYP